MSEENIKWYFKSNIKSKYSYGKFRIVFESSHLFLVLRIFSLPTFHVLKDGWVVCENGKRRANKLELLFLYRKKRKNGDRGVGNVRVRSRSDENFEDNVL